MSDKCKECGKALYQLDGQTYCPRCQDIPAAEDSFGMTAHEQEGMKMPQKRKIVTCPECGEQKEHMGRGLCAACNYRLKKDGTLDDKYPRTRKHAPSPAPKSAGAPQVVTGDSPAISAPMSVAEQFTVQHERHKLQKKMKQPDPVSPDGLEIGAIKQLFIALAPFKGETRERIIDCVSDLLLTAESQFGASKVKTNKRGSGVHLTPYPG